MLPLNKIFSFLFPPACLGCQREDFFICPECVKKIPNKVHEKSFDLKYFEKVFVLTDYDVPLINTALKKLKFRFAKKIVQDLQPFFARSLPWKELPEKIVFVPVPLHSRRQNERGFNQSELLANAFAETLQGETKVIPLLKRIRNTEHQTVLSKEARAENVTAAFCVDQKLAINIFREAPLIIVDDIATTGSTLMACAKTLKEYGYTKVWGLVIARGNSK